jgi:Family of unknown function (DUF6399)
VQVKSQIIAYGQAQTSACQSEQPIGICVGGDETFYGLTIWLPSNWPVGLSSAKPNARTAPTRPGGSKSSQWFNRAQWDCRYFVSDGAKALVKLGLSGLGCPSVPDVFHLLYAVSKSMGTAIARQQAQLQKQQQTFDAKLKAASSPKIIAVVEAQITTLNQQRQTLETEHQDYQQSIHALSQAIHPFEINTGEPQLGLDLPKRLKTPLATLERLSQTHAPAKSKDALEQWQKQVPHLSTTLHAWWQWTLQSLGTQTQDPNTQQWVLTFVLPWVYWHQQAQKTRHPQLKQSYLDAAQLAQKRFQDNGFTLTLDPAQQQTSIDWAVCMCDKFQRTSSAVEGRNGYLSRLHHANRGFTEQTLKVLTVIHNFDLKRDDGSTAAQRLFGKSFPDVFDWVVLNMGELPTPRKSKKPRTSKKPTVHAVPS